LLSKFPSTLSFSSCLKFSLTLSAKATDGGPEIPCNLWFFGLGIQFGDISIGGWEFNLPTGVRPPGPPPGITFPPLLSISVSISGTLPPWPSVTIGPDNLPTYEPKPTDGPDYGCKTESAEVCLTVHHSASTLLLLPPPPRCFQRVPLYSVVMLQTAQARPRLLQLHQAQTTHTLAPLVVRLACLSEDSQLLQQRLLCQRRTQRRQRTCLPMPET
jgi:hypothetical protein